MPEDKIEVYNNSLVPEKKGWKVTLFFPGYTTCREADWGEGTIGGEYLDLRDVSSYYSSGEYSSFKGVEVNAFIEADEELQEEDILEYARHAVDFSYESIGGDTFMGGCRW